MLTLRDEMAAMLDRVSLADAIKHCASDEERLRLQMRLAEIEQQIALRLESLRSHGTL